MAAGQGFKTFTTGEVLTAADTNGYLMQGVLVFADAAARSAAITSPQEGQMSYLKDTNSTEYYSGSTWVAVGAAGGGMTLLSTTTLSGASTTISSISGSYNNLLLYVVGVNPSTTADHFVNLNGVSNLTDSIANSSSNSTASATGRNASTIRFPDNYGSGSTDNSYQLTISRYASSTSFKAFNLFGGFYNGTSRISLTMNGIFRSNTAITSIDFVPNGGTFNGGTVLLYGVN